MDSFSLREYAEKVERQARFCKCTHLFPLKSLAERLNVADARVTHATREWSLQEAYRNLGFLKETETTCWRFREAEREYEDAFIQEIYCGGIYLMLHGPVLLDLDNITFAPARRITLAELETRFTARKPTIVTFHCSKCSQVLSSSYPSNLPKDNNNN